MNSDSAQRAKAKTLLELHHAPELLILTNIWNPIGARILAMRGCPAVATASAAISASLGYEDGERIQRSTLIDMLRRIVASVDIPVSADIESGFGESIEQLEETIREVIATGVVGINLEDSVGNGERLRSVEEQSERIAAARAVADEQDLRLVINARMTFSL